MQSNRKYPSPPQLSQTKKIHIAKLLLQSFMNRKQEERSLTIQQYLSQYASNITPIDDFVFKQEEQVLVGEYLQLRQTLGGKMKQNLVQLRELGGKVGPQYEKIKELMAKRQMVSLEGLSSQLSQEKGDSQQQLGRVRKILANGAWGCLQKLKDRINKLRQLQNEAH